MKKYVYFIILIGLCSFLNLSCKEKLTCKNLDNEYELFSQKKGNTTKDTLRFISALDDLLKSEPICKQAMQLRAFFFVTENNINAAKYLYLKVLSLDNSNIYNLYSLAGVYDLEDKYDSALFFINKALDSKIGTDGVYLEYSPFFKRGFDVSYNELLFFRGIVNSELGNFKPAKEDFLLALKNGHDKEEVDQYILLINEQIKQLDTLKTNKSLILGN